MDDYRFDPVTGLWHHRDGAVEPPLRLRDVEFAADGSLVYPHTRETAPEEALADYLAAARDLFAVRSAAVDGSDSTGLSADFEALRWFELPAASLAD